MKIEVTIGHVTRSIVDSSVNSSITEVRERVNLIDRFAELLILMYPGYMTGRNLVVQGTPQAQPQQLDEWPAAQSVDTYNVEENTNAAVTRY